MANTVLFNTSLMEEDMAAKGWSRAEFARRARVSEMRVSRFFRGDYQTNETAGILARALGRNPRRYIVSRSREASAS